MVVQPRDRMFTMAEAGILRPDERVGLVDGRIVAMNPIGSLHAWCVSRLNRVFARRDDILVNVQNPVRLDAHSEPEPDLAILRLETPQDRHPRPEDILLVVEVADTSLTYDLLTKGPLYARHGIPEFWIVDLGGERVEVHREPSLAGYRMVRIFQRGEPVSPAFAPDLVIDVDTILGQPKSQAEGL